MAMSGVFDAHFKAKFSRSTLAYLLPSKIYVGLLLTSSSNPLLLVSFRHVLRAAYNFESIPHDGYNEKEPGAFLALQALTTELYIVKYLTIGRLLQKSRGEGPNASFDLIAEVGRAVGMGSPSGRRGGHGNSKIP
jgi:hypothetical protein